MPLQDIDARLPRASLLAYFRRAAAAPRPSQDGTLPPPPYDGQRCQKLHPVTLAPYEDEEWEAGFWGAGEQSSPPPPNRTQSPDGEEQQSESQGHIFATCYFVSAMLVYILAFFGAFFVLGLLNRQIHLAIGGPAYGSLNTLEMRFCLMSQNRQAPGPQTWRLIAGGECLSEKITLMVDASEQWKMRFDDEVVVVREGVGETVSYV